MSKKILNYRYISRKLTGKDFTIRSNFVPKSYKKKITELENLVDGWENNNKKLPIGGDIQQRELLKTVRERNAFNDGYSLGCKTTRKKYGK